MICASCNSVVDDGDCQYSDTYAGSVCGCCAGDHVTAEDTGRFVVIDNCVAAYTRYERARGIGFTDTAFYESANSLCELATGEYATRGAVDQSDLYYWQSDDCYHDEPDPYDYDDDVYCSL